jgi:hypothetical protein
MARVYDLLAVVCLTLTVLLLCLGILVGTVNALCPGGCTNGAGGATTCLYDTQLHRCDSNSPAGTACDGRLGCFSCLCQGIIGACPCDE